MTLGIDASLSCTGYCILNNKKELILFGKIQYKENRLKHIYDDIKYILENYKIDKIKMEDGYCGGLNKKGDLSISKARGIIELLAEQYNIKLYTYAPKSIKKEIQGNGNCSKDELYNKLCELFIDSKEFEKIGEFSDKSNKQKTSDIYDSLAIALMKNN